MSETTRSQGSSHQLTGRTSRDGSLAGASLITTGVLYLVVLTYLLTVLAAQGLTFDMFDDPPALLTWIPAHRAAYTTMWLIYLAVTLTFLPAPYFVARTLLRLRASVGWVIGTATVAFAGGVTALVGLVFNYALPSALAPYWTPRDTAGLDQEILVVHDAVSDVGSQMGALANALIATWLLACVHLARKVGAVSGRLPLIVIGAAMWAFVVAVWKFLDSSFPAAGTVAVVLGVAEIAWGYALLRATGRPPTPWGDSLSARQLAHRPVIGSTGRDDVRGHP